MLAALTIGNLASAVTHLHFVGKSRHGKPGADGWTTKTMTVPEGVICPAKVNRFNWNNDKAGRHKNGHDEFEVRQVGTEISVRRIKSKNNKKGTIKGWGVNLAFDCDKHYERVSNACIDVHVGTAKAAGVTKPDKHNRAWTKKNFKIPSEYVCPAQVSKANWKSDATSSDLFRVKQVGNVFAVRRDNGKKGSTQWDMDLKFECCIPDSRCKTVVVGGAGSASVDKQTGWTKGFAVPDGAVCPNVIKKGTWSHEHAMVQHTGFKNSRDVFATKRENGMIYLKRTDKPGRNWAMHVAFECCENTATQHTFEEKCHPSHCKDWSCQDWCACFESAVEDADQYAAGCSSDEDDCICE